MANMDGHSDVVQTTFLDLNDDCFGTIFDLLLIVQFEVADGSAINLTGIAKGVKVNLSFVLFERCKTIS